MRNQMWLLMLILPLAAGCFPIELDVSKDGKLLISREEGFFVFDPATGKAARVCAAEGGKPVFARFSPDGKEVLTVTKVTGGFNEFRFAIAPRTGGKAREVFQGKNTAYVLYAPDGNSFAVTRIPEQKEPKKEPLPELVVVSVKGGPGKVVARNVGVLFRWFADSKRLLVFDVQEQEKDSRYYGRVAVLDVASGEMTPLAAAAATRDFYFDLSPDNKKVLFTALRAGKPGAKVKKGEELGMKLFEVDLATRALRKTDREARYAIYSPDGKKVLLGSPPEGFSLDTLKLEVADADLGKAVPVAPNAYMPLALGGEGITFPGWVDSKTVFYFVSKAVYGTEGKAMVLMTVGADGKGRKCVQPLIDLEAVKESN